MGAFLDKPRTEKETGGGTAHLRRYAYSGMQGWRREMEDAHLVVENLTADLSLFGVFDGHGGKEVSRFVARHFEAVLKGSTSWNKGDLERALEEAFMELDVRIASEQGLKELEQIANDGSVETDVVPDVDVEQLISEGRVPIQEILAAHGYRIAGQDEAVAASAEEDVKDDGSAQLKEAADSGAQGELGNQTDEEETAPPPGEESASRSRVMELLNGPLLPDEDSSGTESSEEEGQEEESPPTEKEYSGKGGEAEEPADGGADGTAPDDAATGWTEPSEGVGVTSGTTSTVAILSANRVIVANSGDGRCVLCRDGTNLDLSVDHKPEDEVEIARITRAGGTVTAQGRVNGGLNLSRAIGDLAYKQTAGLPPEEQMITAFPDITVTELGPTDEFFVMACDGIWNSMESAEVVEFVRTRLHKGGISPEAIMEELLDACMAPTMEGDGTGLDNESALLVLLKEFPGLPTHGTQAKRPQLAG